MDIRLESTLPFFITDVFDILDKRQLYAMLAEAARNTG
jgi:hypothetical protein